MYTFDRCSTKHNREKIFALLHAGYKGTQEIMCEILPDKVITKEYVRPKTVAYDRVWSILKQLEYTGKIKRVNGSWERVENHPSFALDRS